MLKFKLYYDKDEEEVWLKKMCLNGWAFKKFFLGFYTFEKCEPGEYNYQIDLLDNWNGEKDDYWGTATIRAKKTSILFQDFKSSHIH